MLPIPLPAARRRGIAAIFVLVVVAGVAGASWIGHAGRATEAAGTAASAPEAPDASGIDILLGLAGTAAKEQRRLAPAGSNAYEFYFSVLQLDPTNPVATAGLRRLFPDAAADLERAINRGELAEAQRELALLREFDPDNYTLSLLGGKLDAQRQLAVRADETRAAAMQARAGTPVPAGPAAAQPAR